jgi:hypothetical protein
VTVSPRIDTADNGIEIIADGVTLLCYRAITDASKPFVEIVALPSGTGDLSGKNLVLPAPHDHAWHLGLFFCQKLVDGINCWESERNASRGNIHGRGRNQGYEVHEGSETAEIEHKII